MRARKQSTTAQPIPFLMVDSADHTTGKTGLTVTVTLSKNGAAFGAALGAVSEIGNGWYALAGNVTDRGTLGALLLHASAANADPTDLDYAIVAFDPFDANLGLTNLDAAVGTRLATSGYTAPPTAAENADKLLGRNLAAGADGTRTVQDALRAVRNKTALVGGTLTVYQEDDATPAWTAAATTAARDPLASIDPA
jgi:hypothetical protein